MKLSKTSACVMAFAAALVVASAAHAETVFYDGAEFPEEVFTKSTPATDAAYAKMPWTGDFAVRGPGLTYSNQVVLETAGNAYFIDEDGGLQMPVKLATGGHLLDTQGRLGRDGTTVWLSFLVRFFAGSSGTPFAGLVFSKGQQDTLFVGMPAGTRNWCVREGMDGKGATLPKTAGTNETYFIVVRIDFKQGGDDVLMLVNPPVDARSAESFPFRETLRDISAEKIRFVAGGVTAQFDELRIGEKAEDVMPYYHEEAREEGGPATRVYDVTFGDNVLDHILTIKGDTAAGTGFLAEQGGKTYIFSNIHVLMGNRNMKFADRRGRQYKPVSFEAANDRDLVRIAVDAPPAKALKIVEPRGVSTRVIVCGNAEGEDVLRPIVGRLLGIGPGKIETDARFVSGHSGSPVLDDQGNVLGVATYVTRANDTWVNTNTPFMVIRRFGYRVDNVESWVPVAPAWFVKESKLIIEREQKLRDIERVVDLWARGPYALELPVEKGLPQGIRSWIEEHNARVVRNKGRVRTLKTTPQSAASLSRTMHEELKQEVDALANELTKSLKYPPQKFHLAFFQESWESLDQMQALILRILPYFQSLHTSYDPVRLVERR